MPLGVLLLGLTVLCYRKGLVRVFKLLEDPLNDSRRRRDRLSIIADILDVARGGVLKTKIMYRASLSFSQINDYLPFLLNVNLLEAVGNTERTSYKTTNKGLRYLQGYMEIGEMLKKEKNNNSNNHASVRFLNARSPA